MRLRKRDLVAVSLFSGAGGLDLGVESCGVRIAAAVERDATACATLKANFVDGRDPDDRTTIVHDDIENVSVSELKKKAGLSRGDVDMLVGGPPCTPFSKSGYWIDYKRAGLDPDRFLLDHYVRFVKELQPRTFIMENVHALAYDNHNRSSLLTLLTSLEDLGYTIERRVLVAAEFGVPQVRQRLFVIGTRTGPPPRFPSETHAGTYERQNRFAGTGLKPFVTCSTAFAGLRSDPEPGEKVGGLYGHLLPEIPPGENYLHFTKERGHPNPLFKWRGRYWTFLLKLDPDKPSSTIQAQPGPYIGPFHWENRRLRVPELKALMTFPQEFKLVGNRRAAQMQLGNAVPPLLASVVAEELIQSALEKSKKIA